ncbi:non-muscle cofilin 1-like [Archocentrus centrarchus]|uniref:non-muscle cofilin 1-like n=1 Tax=Archocentrus centrarchus TaxID=63155 RepID=UPI0011EA3BB2|nr:destrin [Archocentrus centrarchus]
MASGVQVTDEVKDIINNMKVVKTDADLNERIRLVIFRIDDSEGAIVVDKVYRQKDLADVPDVFKFFVGLLDSKTCRYLMYDCHFETKESSKKEELVAVMWAPDTAPIKEKMKYASSKDSLKKNQTGVKHMLEMNDLSDYGTRESFAERMAKGVIKLEGHSVNA